MTLTIQPRRPRCFALLAKCFWSVRLSLSASGVLAAALPAQQHPITWTLTKPPLQVTQGATITARLHATIPAGWHLYSLTQPPGGPLPTVITLPEGSAFAISGRIAAPDPDVAVDRNFDILTETYTDSVTFPVRVLARTAGTTVLAISVAYQTCTDRFCLPPTSEVVETNVNVIAAPSGSVIPNPEPTPATTPLPVPFGTRVSANSVSANTAPGNGIPDVTKAISVKPTPSPGTTANIDVPLAVASPNANASAPAASLSGTTGLRTTSAIAANPTTGSLPLFLWLAAVMGALSLLTPCVFPMIPITVSYFTRTSHSARATPARNALVYAAGIMATFTVLGMAIALLVGAGGINRFAANPWVNLLVTAVFIAFALNLFGAWQFTLPSALLTRLTAASNGSRAGETVGILAMGLTFTLTSFTCTAPFVGTLLVMAAGGDWQWPLLGLLVFSAVFALPFFLLAMMPSAIARLPRSGSWLESVKVVMGFIEIATAMKFLANADLVWRWGIFTRTVVLVVWIVTALVAALYLFGVLNRTEPRRVARLQQAFAAICVLIALILGRGLRGARLGELESFLPPPEGAVTHGTVDVKGELPWMVNDYNGGLRRAKAEHKSVLVDFTGYTCTNCRWMEANMFPRAEIAKELDRFVRVRLYTDGQGELYRAQQQMELDKFGTVALPYYAVVDSLGNPQSQFLGMTRSSDEYLAFLRATSASVLLR